MSIFTAAVDSHISQLKQLGENGHVEWGEEKGPDFKERITQFQFQCVRCESSGLHTLEDQLTSILSDTRDKDFLSVLYKLIGQTRDIVGGKGERQISYMMILVWWRFYPELAKFALLSFVKINDDIPYGSWKDIKKLCEYVKDETDDSEHPLILYGIELICDQLRLDSNVTNNSDLSLCSRWVPRESSKKSKWLFRKIAVTYFPDFISTATNIESLEKAKRKTYMTFGRFVSSMNKRLDTVQIKMCGKTWSDIDHNKTTSITIMKNRNAFMNNSKKYKDSDNADRIECAINFKDYIESRVSKGLHVKGKRIGIVDFVVEGMKVNSCIHPNHVDIDTINSQWSSFMEQVGDLNNMVAMVDQSGSMAGDPYHAAVGLGIAVASKSALGKRVMTFSYEPEWVNMEHCDNFMSYITKIQSVQHLAGFGTNFFKALKLVLDACVKGKVPDSVVRNMTLAIFSDMQIDAYSTTEPYGNFSNIHSTNANIPFDKKMLTMHERIREMYLEAGYTGVPHILFWNLRHTSGYPTKSNMKNATMFSGFSPVLLNSFCNKGAEALLETTPWDALLDSLSNQRYDMLEQKIGEYM
jgi:hypothetical protein